MARNKTPKPEVPTVEEAPVTDTTPPEENLSTVETETSDEVPTVEEEPVIDSEVKPMTNREAARLLREKHQG